MKGCMAEAEAAYHLLPAMEFLNQKTSELYEKTEDMSMQLLQQNLRSDHDSVLIRATLVLAEDVVENKF